MTTKIRRKMILEFTYQGRTIRLRDWSRKDLRQGNQDDIEEKYPTTTSTFDSLLVHICCHKEFKGYEEIFSRMHPGEIMSMLKDVKETVEEAKSRIARVALGKEIARSTLSEKDFKKIYKDK